MDICTPPLTRIKYLLLLTAFLFFKLSAFAQHRKLSDQAHLSVLTYGPWQEELYSAFGHNAFRVYDPVQNIDEAYDYGVFDFDQPHFYLNFAKGYLYYQLGVHDYQASKAYYIYNNRYIHEQVLDLTPDQLQKVYDTLQWNALPENEHYRYDYFYNNCATKLRDVIQGVLGDSVFFDGSYIKTDYTIRDLTDQYLQYQPWGDLGIDICLGLPMDKVASPSEYMFLPPYVESGFDHAYVIHGKDTSSLVRKKIIVYSHRDEAPPSGLPHPLYVFGILAMLGVFLSVSDFRRKKISTWFDIILFSVTGLIGVLLFFLWGFTDHAAAAYNFNLLWAIPTHVIVAIVLFKNSPWIKTYFLVTLIIQVLLLLFWPFLPQALNYSLIPIVILLAARSFVQYYIRRQLND